MTQAKRARGSHRAVYFLCAVVALGLALSACGGGSSPAGASAAQSSAPTSTAVASGARGSDSSGSDSSGYTSNPPTPSSGVVTINWAPPMDNTNGTPLINLAGYHIHYGPRSGDYTQTISVPNPGIATYVVQNLPPGTYYFAVGAVNSDGTESPLSGEISAIVN